MGFAASDNALGVQFVPSGKDLLFAFNMVAGAATVTITLADDEYGRGGAITTYSLGAQYDMAWFGILDAAYNSSSLVLIDTSDDDVYLAVLRLP